MSPSLSPIAGVAGKALAAELPISPFAGEMPGGTEEGASPKQWTLKPGNAPQLFHMHHRPLSLPILP